MDYVDGPMTTGDVAIIFGVTTSTVKRWADSGVLAHFKTAGGHYRFRPQDVEALKASQASTPEPAEVAS